MEIALFQIQSYHLTSESTEIENTVISEIIRPSLPKTTLEQANNCTNIKVGLSEFVSIFNFHCFSKNDPKCR